MFNDPQGTNRNLILSHSEELLIDEIDVGKTAVTVQFRADGIEQIVTELEPIGERTNHVTLPFVGGSATRLSSPKSVGRRGQVHEEHAINHHPLRPGAPGRLSLEGE